MATQPSQVVLGPVAHGGFPARRLTKSNYEGGEWVIAYQAEQRSRLKAVFLSRQQRQKGGWASGHLSPPANTREASGLARRVLDKEFLQKHCFVSHPSDLSVADISGANLRAYKANGFTEFGNLVHITASDNELPMEAFKEFPTLQQLELSLCGTVDVTIGPNDFSKLQFLDLSYNSLSGMALLVLGTLPSLKELHLTGNNIVALPVEMSRPFSVARDTTGGGGLRYLNLDNNEMYMIPQLKLLGTSPLKSATTPSRGQKHTAPNRLLVTHSGSPLQQEIRHTPHTTLPQIHEEDHTPTGGAESARLLPEVAPHRTGGCLTAAADRERETSAVGEAESALSVSRLPHSMAPFPELQTLSIANNLFLSAEGLLACGCWPALRELIIYGNPLIRVCRGMPPQLQTELVQKCNLKIVRQKPQSKVPFCIGEAAKTYKKVSTSPPPTIPKQPLLALPPIEDTPLVIEPPSPSLSPTPSSSHLSSASPSTHSQPDIGPMKTTEQAPDNPDSREEGEGESIFITQVTGEAEDAPSLPETVPTPQSRVRGKVVRRRVEEEGERKAWSAKREMKAWTRQLRQKYSDLPEHYRGYEALLEGDRDEVTANPTPTDLHACVHALRYALKHPLTVSSRHSTKPRHTAGSQRKPSQAVASPRQTSSSHKVQELQSILDDIRNKTTTLEANLAEILQESESATASKTPKQQQKEGRLLLAELQAKYDEVRTKSLQEELVEQTLDNRTYPHILPSTHT